ncbi:peptidase family M48-domain-containing protein [Favolaschia claudopus]|uniref:Peptidase family M48-domain-containing protein n=1 Tax=Favolaschia claudopus TaxID=2862362 RepID=A0AAW0D1C8_9AGAR
MKNPTDNPVARSLETIPATGRRRFIVVSSEDVEEMRHIVLEDVLQKHGRKILCWDHPVSQDVRRVAGRIISQNGLGYIEGQRRGTDAQDQDSKPWNIIVIDDEADVDAFTLSGRVILISTGILPVTRDEAGLAALLAHEISHGALRHPEESLSCLMFIYPFRCFLRLLRRDTRFLELVRLSLEAPHSRMLESEADMYALRLLRGAGYEGAALPRFLADLAETDKESDSYKIPAFLRSHPPLWKRIKDLEARLSSDHTLIGALSHVR